MESILLLALKGLTWLVTALPVAKAISLLESVIRGVLFFLPKYKRIALRNLEIAFPEKEQAWREKTWRLSLRALARLIVDALRVKQTDARWLQEHIDCPLRQEFELFKRSHPKPGVLIAAGHLGSFELLARYSPSLGYPLAAVARNFQMKKIDEWWNGMRAAYGNRVISRRGAFNDVVKTLRRGHDVAVLIDQNVRIQHAVFVDWFGKAAATTRMFALAALKTRAPVVVASISKGQADRYQIDAVFCPVEDVYDSAGLTLEEKALEITRRVSLEYERMIRAHPEEWFWMHRRWRTRPPGETENVYAGC